MTITLLLHALKSQISQILAWLMFFEEHCLQTDLPQKRLAQINPNASQDRLPMQLKWASQLTE